MEAYFGCRIVSEIVRAKVTCSKTPVFSTYELLVTLFMANMAFLCCGLAPHSLLQIV